MRGIAERVYNGSARDTQLCAQRYVRAPSARPILRVKDFFCARKAIILSQSIDTSSTSKRIKMIVSSKKKKEKKHDT